MTDQSVEHHARQDKRHPCEEESMTIRTGVVVKTAVPHSSSRYWFDTQH